MWFKDEKGRILILICAAYFLEVIALDVGNKKGKCIA